MFPHITRRPWWMIVTVEIFQVLIGDLPMFENVVYHAPSTFLRDRINQRFKSWVDVFRHATNI